jgi:enoyl-CoA hydratase/3-hydroxyacyl-CoA dehydrogenase
MLFRKVSVIGAGSMGHGIAELVALAGYEVWLNDVSDEILKRALDRIRWSLSKLSEKGQIKEGVNEILSRIKVTVNQEEALRGSDLVIEAVLEDINVKKKVFAKADELASSEAILASNTSSLPITEIAQATKRPERVIGMHFFNPPVLMPLVEIIRGEKSSEESIKKAYDFAKAIGKEPVLVNKDLPGFLVNRILTRVQDIACYLVEKGKASVIEIDATSIYDLGFPMGVFLLADYTGLDIAYSVFKAMSERGFKAYDCKTIESKYREGNLGVKTGKGIYNYPAPGKYERPKIPFDKLRREISIILLSPAVNEAAMFLRERIATREDIDKACKLGLGWPKGILEYADEFGVDNVVKALESLWKEGLSYLAPDPLLIQMVKEGKIGKKVNSGFYDYEKEEERKFSTIIVRIEKPIAWITLNRPERLNAINDQLAKELNSALDELEEREEVRVIVITGTGNAFSAGADITSFIGLTPVKGMMLSRRLQELYNKIQFLTKPVIASINGYALGGGLELAMACDIRIASDKSQFGQPEINLGIIPGAGGTQRLPRIARKLTEIIYTGEMIDAKRALEGGLVDRVVEHQYLEQETRKIAMKLAEKPPLAIAAAKYAINFGLNTDIWTGLAYEASLFGILFSTKDVIEGVSAFLEKRRPNFKGE